MSLRLPRRKALKAAVGLALLGGLSAAIGVVRTSGYEVPAGTDLAGLSAWEWVLVRELARRVCAPDRDGVVTPDEADVAGFVGAYAAKMPRRMRRDLGRFFAFVEHVAPLAIGRTRRFSLLGPSDQDRVLASLEAHDSEMLRGGFDGIKSLLFMGYYRDPRTWSLIGYDGPLVARPENGWAR